MRFGSVRALDDVSFSVGRGEVHWSRRRERKRQEHRLSRSSPASIRPLPARAPIISVRALRRWDAAARASQRRGGDLAGLGAFPGNDGRREHRVRRPRARRGSVNYRAMREIARAAPAKLGVELDQRAAEKSADFRQIIGGDRRVARERTAKLHLWRMSPPPAHAGRDRPLARRGAHAGRVRRRCGLREPSACGKFWMCRAASPFCATDDWRACSTLRA